VSTAYRAVVARGGVGEGDSVLVIGCGGVGLAAVAIARSRGAFVCAVDVSAASLDRALFHGADEVVDASIGTEKVLAAVSAWSGGGVSVSVDALGSPEACRTGILALRRRGRHVQVGLLPPAAGRADVPMERVIAWELDVLGSHGMAAADYGPLLDDVASGRLDLGDLLAPGEPLGLAEAGEALAAMGSAPSRGIVLVDPSR
jgi:alcohol dehydrogenase